MPNINVNTGYPYGVIACASLDSDLVQELLYGLHATDHVYEEAYKEAKQEAERTHAQHVEEAEIAAREVDANMPESDREAFIEAWLDKRGIPDQEQYVEEQLDGFSDRFESDTTNVSGTHEGVTYLIGDLGGALILWSVNGPLVECESPCSPCVPGAMDLDSGFTWLPIDEQGCPNPDRQGVCHGIPRDWLADDGQLQLNLG